ncbi:MAG: hypothetical protein Q7W02_12825 [Candidatus Rokubacteria bacterium]|nr:hypothetical protein [Candidatus Rokubacteria bacterium]
MSLATVQLRVGRAAGERLDRVDWEDHPTGCRPAANRLPVETEDLVLHLRRELKATSDLGEYGAVAIRRELLNQEPRVLPSVRSIGRVLERRGALDGHRRTRRPAPPPGWYLPAVARRETELDSFDIVAGLVIRGGTDVEVLNAMSLHGGLAASWPRSEITAKTAVESLLEHWRSVGLPAYAQFATTPAFRARTRIPTASAGWSGSA